MSDLRCWYFQSKHTLSLNEETTGVDLPHCCRSGKAGRSFTSRVEHDHLDPCVAVLDSGCARCLGIGGNIDSVQGMETSIGVAEVEGMSSTLTMDESEKLLRMKHLGQSLAALRYKEG